MAEVVEYRKECTLPEYEQMRVLNLFTHEEILKMKKSRENFEYRIAQSSRNLKDFVDFIKYERSVLGLTKQRTKLQKLTKNHTISSLITSRMKNLYVQALSKFPHNLLFWDEYIRFLHQFKFIEDISSTLDQMLQFHSDKIVAWIRAILWEYNENFTDERVKGLLLRAQQLHPESQQLYLLFFQIALENKSQTDECVALKLADIVYTNGKKKFQNASFYIEMLNIVDKFSYANTIQLQILQNIQAMFRNDEYVWHFLAQRQLEGLPSIKLIESEAEDDGCDENSILQMSEQSSFKKRIQMCQQVYKKAVKSVNTLEMWNYYLNAMVELNIDLSTHAASKRHALSQAFELAYQSNSMVEYHYLQYIELLYANNPKNERIERILEKAIEEHTSSPDIWFQYVQYFIKENDPKKLKQLRNAFETAKKRLGPDSANIWYLYLTYLKSCQSSETNAEFERLVKELACQPHSNFTVVKAQILEFLERTTNLKRTRDTYNLFTKYFPGCYDVYEMMAKLEAKQPKRDLKSERRCLEMLTMNFGKIRTDVWLRYIRFERDVGDPKNVGRLYQTALAALNPDLLDEFSRQYNLFLNGDN